LLTFIQKKQELTDSYKNQPFLGRDSNRISPYCE